MAGAKDEAWDVLGARVKKLEAERDEALAEVDRLIAGGLRLAEERETLRRERDAAVAQVEAKKGHVFVAELDVSALTTQRDALLAVVEGLIAALPPERCRARSSRDGVTCRRDRGHDGAHEDRACGVLTCWPDSERGPDRDLSQIERAADAARTALAQAKGGVGP